MELEVSSLSADELYQILTHWVAPRPIAWVSTVNKDGTVNLAPFSFFNLVCDQPPVLLLSISKREDGSRKDTSRNILETGEFVVNFVKQNLLEKVEFTGKEFPPDASELELAGLTPEPPKRVKPPRVKEAPASFECNLIKHMELYDYDIILGEVVFLVIREEKVEKVGRVRDSFCRCRI